MSSAFSVPGFRRLWAAGLISDAGDWLLFIALPLVVYRLTGSALGTSLAFLLELIPAVVLAPIAARLVNRLDRRWLMVAINVLQAIALVPLLFVHTKADLPLVYIVIVAQAALGTAFEPAKNALLPNLVGPEQLVSANALVGLNQNLGRLIGGPLGGVLLAVGDLELVVAVDAVSYLLSALLIAAVPSMPRQKLPIGSDAPGARQRGTGLMAVLRKADLRGTFAVMFLTSIAQGMFLVLFVLFVVDTLSGSDGDVGLLRGVQAIGAIAAGLALGIFGKKSSARVLAAAGSILFGVISLLTWNLPLLTSGIPPYVVLFIIVGAPGVIMMTGIVTSLQSASADSERGSVFTMLGLVSALGQAIGMLAAGLLDAPWGILPLLELQGAIYFAGGVLAWMLMPRHVRAPVGAR
ncbi:MFS transporter [Rathayibacter soli]|uniref:MFS transporter n=1 Tax=Rathayibacter soli TaxID=3144168 RepID=UPI0027E50A95|nr:MFS transporter [Glaciibacter superstes]